MDCLIKMTINDFTMKGISLKGNVIVEEKSTKQTALISRVNMNKLLNNQVLSGIFNTVEGFDLPMFMVLKF
jgi:hypothetical protein